MGTGQQQAMASAGAGRVAALSEVRRVANERFFEKASEPLAHCCHQMAERFAAGGRLIAFGASPQARSDARHIAVEFVHPVIVGKRALPAIGLTPEGGDLSVQLATVVSAADIVVFFGEDAEADARARSVLPAARERGCLTIAFASLGAEWEFAPEEADPFVRQELIETLYHVLWELVHVFFEHRGLLEGRDTRTSHDAGGSSFLYPFLAESETDLDSVINDVRGSVLVKAADIGDLRERTLAEDADQLHAAAARIRELLDAGGKVLTLGNGGSATDATDLVADLRHPPAESGWPSRSAMDLTEDSGILTAIANDIGPEEIFQRQLIAYGKPGDAVIVFTTSGGSANVLLALEEARRAGITTVAFTGYDGGRIAAEGLADHVIVSRSQHIPRIQEAQASAYHVLRHLIEEGSN